MFSNSPKNITGTHVINKMPYIINMVDSKKYRLDWGKRGK